MKTIAKLLLATLTVWALHSCSTDDVEPAVQPSHENDYLREDSSIPVTTKDTITKNDVIDPPTKPPTRP